MSIGAWTPTVGGILIAVIGAWATWRTARVARLANDREAAIDGWQQWRADAQALRADRDALLRDIAKIRRELDVVEERLEGCVDWVKAVIPVLKAQGIPFPPPPPGITDTDPGLRPPRRF